MEYLAEITKEEKENKNFWKYTFLNVETGEENCFYHNKRINYVPDLVGKLKLTKSDNQGHRFYLEFKQEVANPREEGSITRLEERIEKDNEVSDNKFTRRPIKLSFPQLIEFVNELHKLGMSWKEIATRFRRTDRMVRYWRKLVNQPLKKVGRKRKIQGNDLILLLSYANHPDYNAKTQQEMSDYIFKETGHRYSQQVISYTLKRDSDITRKRATKQYLEQDLVKVRQFLIENYQIFSSPNCLAMDEFGTNLGEAPRYAYSRRGLRAIVPRPGQRGFNHTLFLCVRNVEKQAVVSYKLVKNIKKKIKDEKTGKEKIKKGTDALDFYNFLKEIELPTNETYYLLLDNSKIHRTTKELEKLGLSIEGLARQKNIILVYLPSSSPQINPVELCFNTVRHLTEKSQSRNDEELNANVVKIINILNEKDMTKYFRRCRDYFSFDKNEIS